MTRIPSLTVFITAMFVTLWLQGDQAAAQNDVNGPRSDQSKGKSSIIDGKGDNGLGQNGISRIDDIRRTSTGELQFSGQRERQIRDAVGKAHLQKQSHVNFTISVGVAVPKQAAARDLPKPVADAVGAGTPLQYVLAQDRLILIDKKTARIVAIVPGVA